MGWFLTALLLPHAGLALFGGALHAENRPEGGARFTLELLPG